MYFNWVYTSQLALLTPALYLMGHQAAGLSHSPHTSRLTEMEIRGAVCKRSHFYFENNKEELQNQSFNGKVSIFFGQSVNLRIIKCKQGFLMLWPASTLLLSLFKESVVSMHEVCITMHEVVSLSADFKTDPLGPIIFMNSCLSYIPLWKLWSWNLEPVQVCIPNSYPKINKHGKNPSQTLDLEL